ncbi:hypothetical protein KAU34_10435 [candidate division WOR-3 bacterium]|nr:hypothetical protein [candidate division WOR-3 bacterium]
MLREDEYERLEKNYPGKTFEIKDSGNRTEYPGGALRDNCEGKIRWDLLPVEALKRVARHYTTGAKKYSENNWKKGIPTERFIEGACRHWAQYRLGEEDEDHLSAIVFNILGIIFNEERGDRNNAHKENKKEEKRH